MEYPNNFNIPTFSAGKSVALSRSVAVWISVVFFLIISACGFVLLGRHYKQNYPFLISIDPYTEEWNVVSYPKHTKEKIQQYKVIQEKLVRDYMTDWFTITNDKESNDLRWKKCQISDCTDSKQFNPDNLECSIACKSGMSLFEDFSKIVLPEYRARVETGGETWNVKWMMITQNKASEQSGKWQVFAVVVSNISGPFNVLAFVDIDRNVKTYPANLGYYVKNFNAYRITNE